MAPQIAIAPGQRWKAIFSRHALASDMAPRIAGIFAWCQGLEQFHEARLIKITLWGVAIWLDPFGMLHLQVVVNLLPELGIGVDLVRHANWVGESEFHKRPFIWGWIFVMSKIDADPQWLSPTGNVKNLQSVGSMTRANRHQRLKKGDWLLDHIEGELAFVRGADFRR